ncbi:MAG: hypothetical protein KBF30_07895, partial [Hyphomonadaceae bacterium]|nr:hypothetical protein [Hyphomonadaceae bacterium]
LEGARSLSLWALITDLTSSGTDQDRRRAEELAEAEHRKALAAINAVPPPPPVAEPAPIIAPLPEMVLTDAQRRGRAGGLATAQAKAAAKARDGSYILVPSLVSRDAQAPAMKVAAE